MYPNFTEEIKSLRLSLNITASEMAHMMCVSPSYLSSIERGLRPLTRGAADRLVAFFQQCKCDTSDLELEFDLHLGSIDIQENPVEIQRLLSRVSRNPKLLKLLAKLETESE